MSNFLLIFRGGFGSVERGKFNCKFNNIDEFSEGVQ